MYPIAKEAHALALRKTTGFMAGTYRSIGEKQTMVRGLTQDFMRKNISRLAIATWIETIVYEVKLRIDAVETVGKEEFHSSSIPA